jgi:hypothetical protein
MDADASGHDDRAISLALAANQLLEFVPRRKLHIKSYPRQPFPVPGTVIGTVSW